MRRRTLLALLVLLGLVLAAVAVVLLRRVAPPEPARLLPPADAFFYFNLKPLRSANLLRQAGTVKLDPEYEKFVQQTGFQFERDLDEAAFAVHYARPSQETGQRPEPRFSEVFVARFDSRKVSAYLRSISAGVDSYREVEIFNVPLPGRTVRVAILGPTLVAASNHEDPNVIRGIIQRSKQLARPFAGPELLHRNYRRLPFATLAWVIARLPAAGENNTGVTLPGGIAFSFPPASVLLASIRYTGEVQLRAAVYTANQADAQRLTEQFRVFLNVFRSVEANVQPGGPDPDVKAFFDSFRVEQRGERAELTATLPQGFLKKLLSEPPSATPAAPEKPAQPKSKSRKKK